MFLVCSLVLAAVHLQVSSAQDRGQCTAFSDAISAHNQCEVGGSECRAVRCLYPGVQPATLTLNSCTDPPEVELLLGTRYSGSSWVRSFAIRAEESSCDVAMSSLFGTSNRVSATFSRNASHINFRAHVIAEGDIAMTAIPEVALPLDILGCACDSLYRASDEFNLDIPGVSLTCFVNDSTTCSDYRCYGNSGSTTLVSNAIIDPCTESVTVTVTNPVTESRVWREVFSQNRSVQVDLNGFSPTLYVTIVHFNYSMIVAVDMSIYGSYNTTIIRQKKIILDRSSCSSPTIFPAAPYPYGSSDGCLRDPYNYPIDPDPTYPTYPTYPEYPDYSEYPEYPTGQTYPTDYPYFTYPTNYPHPPTDGPSSPNTGSHVEHARTCQALQKIASSSASQCSVVDSCTAVDCFFMGQYQAKLTVETCHNPPAVGMLIRDLFGDTIVNETLVNSKTQPIEFNHVHLFDLHTSIKHVRNPDSLVLKVSIHTLTGQDLVVLPDTTIPIDRCGCPGIACSASDNTSGKHSSSLVKILVPVGVIVLLLVVVAVAVAVVVGVVIAKKKQGSGYSFQRMAFNTATEDVATEDVDEK